MSTMAMVAGLVEAVVAGNVEAVELLERALSEGVSDAPKGVTFHVVMTKARKRAGHVYPAEVVKGAFAVVNTVEGSIRIFGIKNLTSRDSKYRTAYDRTFKVGDVVEYDSYNLAYHGTITKVTPSGVTVAKDYGRGAARLDLDVFTWRNYDLDLEANAARNFDVMQNT